MLICLMMWISSRFIVLVISSGQQAHHDSITRRESGEISTRYPIGAVGALLNTVLEPAAYIDVSAELQRRIEQSGVATPDCTAARGAGSSRPSTLLPAPCTLRPTPCTLHPTPYTLHPAPHTLHHTPYTLHPTPYTLHPAPYTLHPAPTAGGECPGKP